MILWQEKLEGNGGLGFSVCKAIGKLGTLVIQKQKVSNERCFFSLL
jgi:hypothetical protein